MTELTKKPVKIFEPFSVALAVFFGSPLAGGWVLRKNFTQLGRKKEGDKWLGLSVFFTILLFTAVFFIPEDVPNSATVALNTAICGFYASLAKRFFGEETEIIRREKNGFLSRWNALLSGIISFAIIIAVVFGAVFILEENKYNTEADKQIKEKYSEVFQILDRNGKLLNDFYRSADLAAHNGRDEIVLEILEQFESSNSSQWKRINALIVEIEELARANGREGVIVHIGIVKEIPPLEIEKGSLYREYLTGKSEKAEQAINDIFEKIEIIYSRLHNYLETVDESHEDILYLLP